MKSNGLEIAFTLRIYSEEVIDTESIRFLAKDVELPFVLENFKFGQYDVAGEAYHTASAKCRIYVRENIIASLDLKNAIRLVLKDKEGTEYETGLTSRWFLGKYKGVLTDKVYFLKDMNMSAYFLITKYNLVLTIRPCNVTDKAFEKFKLACAYLMAMIFKGKDPILLYEKDSARYEESGHIVFEKLVDQGYDNAYFVLDENCADWRAAPQKYKKYVLKKYSFKHYLYFFRAKTFIGSENVAHAIELRCISKYVRLYLTRGMYNFVFLQHGIMYMISLDAGQRQFFRQKKKNGFRRTVVSSHLELDHFVELGGYSEDELYLCGLPKFDRNEMNPDADKIAIMLTWRPWEERTCKEDVNQSSYIKSTKQIVENIPQELHDRLIIMPHPLIKEAMKEQHTGLEEYIVGDEKYDDILKDVSLLITDYSSVSYDAFYRGSKVIFYWKEKDQCVSQYGENAKLMLTEDLAFGRVYYDDDSMKRELLEVYSNPQEKKHIENYSKLVEFHDGKNTDRLMEMLKKEDLTKVKKALTNKYNSYCSGEIMDKAVLLEAGQGKATNGSMFALLREIEENPDYEEYVPYFVVNDKTEDSAKAKFDFYGFKKVKLIIRGDDTYQKILAQAKYLYTDNSLPPYFNKRSEQVFVETWHGTPLKRLGRSDIRNSASIGNVQKNYFMADYALFPNEFTRDVFYDDYMIRNIFSNKVLLLDYPRNDALLRKEEAMALREKLGLKDKEVFAYMPTWRGSGRSAEDAEQVKIIAEKLKEIDGKLRDDQVLLVNLHFLIESALDYDQFKHIKGFPKEYETYDILAFTDKLVSDYSSVFFDYGITGKPIVLFAYDLEEYLEAKGTYFDIYDLPFPIVKSVDELIDALNSDEEIKGYKEFQEKYCAYSDGKAAKHLLDLSIKNDSTGLTIEDAFRNEKPNAVYNIGDISNEYNQQEILKALETLDTDKTNVILIFSTLVNQETGAFLEKIPKEMNYVRVLAPKLNQLGGLKGKIKKSLGLDKKAKKEVYSRELNRLIYHWDIASYENLSYQSSKVDEIIKTSLNL